MGCFGCHPKPGVGANFGCAVVEEWGPIGKAASAVWKMVQVIKFGMDNLNDFLDGPNDPNGNGIICYEGGNCGDDEEEKARGLARLDAPKKSMLMIKPQMAAASGAQSNLDCDYLDPFGEGYRGTANVAASGKPCLPWPQEWVVLHHGGGMAKDPSACAGIPADTKCWDACLAQLEVNQQHNCRKLLVSSFACPRAGHKVASLLALYDMSDRANDLTIMIRALLMSPNHLVCNRPTISAGIPRMRLSLSAGELHQCVDDRCVDDFVRGVRLRGFGNE